MGFKKSEYEGGFREDLKCGEGVVRFPGCVMEGRLNEDELMEGKARITYEEEGVVYEGEMVAGMV